MPPEKHCWWSPSSAKENILCPARARMIQQVVKLSGGPPPSGKEAKRGTEIHEVMEAYNNSGVMSTAALPEEWQRQCCIDMAKYQSGLTLGSIDKFVEVRAELKIAGEKIFGTADFVIYDKEKNILIIMDYKSGIGYPVDATMNEQLMVYALGVLEKHELDLLEPNILLAINQPRVYDKLKTYSLSYENLMKWKTSVLEPAIKQAKAGEPCVPGEVQCRWCAASGNICKAEKEYILDKLPELADLQGAEVINLEPEFIADILSKEKQILKTIKTIKARAIKRVEQGEKFPGLKLVETRGNKRWVDEAKAAAYLGRHKIKQNERFVTRIVSPSKALKLLSEKGQLTVRTNGWMDRNVERPVTGITLVPESDPRPEHVTETELLKTIDEIETDNLNLEDLL